MAQTLQGYITEVRRLLHDANGNFYTDSQLTDYINAARERVVRDTGCLRTIQLAQLPMTPVPGGANPYFWSANTAVHLNDYVVSNVYIYKVTQAGTLDGTAPPYPTGQTGLPPSAPFMNGTAQLQYAGNSELINYACLPSGLLTLDVLNVNLFWGNTRVPMQYLAWTDFNAKLRFWQNYIGRPCAFSVFGQQQLYFGPIPDQVYTIELDTIILPTLLVNMADTDTINYPYTTPVAFYSAYTAKYYEQSFGEAEIYKNEYIKHVQAVLASIMTRRIPNTYATGY
jgi:hypothetical protein